MLNIIKFVAILIIVFLVFRHFYSNCVNPKTRRTILIVGIVIEIILIYQSLPTVLRWKSASSKAETTEVTVEESKTAKLEDLQAEIDRLTKENKELQASIEDNESNSDEDQTEIDRLTKENSELQKEITTLTEENKTLEEQVTVSVAATTASTGIISDTILAYVYAPDGNTYEPKDGFKFYSDLNCTVEVTGDLKFLTREYIKEEIENGSDVYILSSNQGYVCCIKTPQLQKVKE